jgi:uncharacterized protein YqiB (DUF1249 family)
MRFIMVEQTIVQQTIYEKNYALLERIGILPVILTDDVDYMKMTSDGYMDLSVDSIGENRIAIAHNYIQNGDVMAAPDMEIKVFPDLKQVEAMTYQLDSMGVFQQVYLEDGRFYPKLKTQLNQFLNQWLMNLVEQGHVVTEQK